MKSFSLFVFPSVALGMFLLGACTKTETAAVLNVSPQEDSEQILTVVNDFRPDPVQAAVGDEDPKRYGGEREPLPPPVAPTPETISEIAELVTVEVNTVGVPASDRAVWGAFADTSEGRRLIQSGERQLNDPLPELTRDLWLLFEREGDRKEYQDAFSARMNRLVDLSLAEALEYEGRFIPAIIENIQQILDQGAWSVPAHGRSLEVFEGKRPVVDLAAAQLAWSLATIDYWLADELPSDLRQRIKSEMERRVFNPYLRAVRTGKPFWWMVRPNNWMAVCAGAVTGAALTIEPDPQVRAEFIAIAQTLLQRYIDGFSSDGISEEGISYWSFGFSHFLYASEAIRRTTNGAIDLLANEQTQVVSQSPRNLEIIEGVYGAFGDQSIGAKADLSLSNFAALRYGMKDVEHRKYGKIGPGRRHPLSPQLYSLIVFAFGENSPPVEGFSISADDSSDIELRSWFPESELFIFRPGTDDPGDLGLAFRIGNNGEFHNHNDIGSFVVAMDGVPVLIDPGMERYTKNSFSAKRYDIPLNNSFGHPVPLVGNRMQKSGLEARGTVLETFQTPEEDRVTIDMTDAYRTPGLVRLVRKVRYLRPGGNQGSKIVIRDEVEFQSPEDFSTALITRGTISVLEEGVVEFETKGRKVYAQIETGGRPIGFDQSPVTGFSTPASRGIKRLGVYLAEPVQKAFIEITLTSGIPEDAANLSQP